jgi:hypothetical protein
MQVNVKRPHPVLVALVLCVANQFGTPYVEAWVAQKPVVPAPIVADKFCTLLVEETDQRGSITPDQRDAILSTDPDSLRGYIKSVGGEFMVLDKDQADLQYAPKWAQDAYARPHPTTPWVVHSNGKTGFEGPLAEKRADILERAKKYGGVK